MEIGPLNRPRKIPQDGSSRPQADITNTLRPIVGRDDPLHRERLKVINRRIESGYYYRKDITKLVVEKLVDSSDLKIDR